MVSKAWQLERTAAERYEQFAVPAILGPFARALVAAAEPAPGEAVLDVGSGTGAAARIAAEAVGTTGSVVATDVNPSMIEVGRSLPARGARIDWLESPAESVPIPGKSADVVLCAQVLQFVADKQAALREMGRVARPGGRVAVSTWCGLEENPYFAALSNALAQELGVSAAGGLRAAFSLSDAMELRGLFGQADLPAPRLTAHELALTLPRASVFVPGHIAGTPLASVFASAARATRDRVVEAVRATLLAYGDDGAARIPFRSWLAVVHLD